MQIKLRFPNSAYTKQLKIGFSYITINEVGHIKCRIENHLRIISIDCIGELSKIKTNLIGVDFFLEVNEHIIIFQLYFT